VKVGDLVRCTWQPGTRADSSGYILPMKYVIKDKFGFLVRERNQGTWFVFFPDYAYTHPLATSALEVISESR